MPSPGSAGLRTRRVESGVSPVPLLAGRRKGCAGEPAHALLVVAADRLAEGEVFADVQSPFARFDLADPRVGGRPASPPQLAWSDFRNLEKTSRLLQGAAPGHRCRLGGRGATRAFADGEAAVPPISVISNVVSILHSVADCGAGWGAAVQPSSATSARHARQAVRMASKCNLEKTLQITSRRRGEAEVAEAGSGSRFSRSNPQTCRSAISAPPRGSSSSRRRCNLEKTLQITSRRRGEAEVAEAGSGSRFSRSNPKTSRSAISAPPRGSSSSRRRCDLL